MLHFFHIKITSNSWANRIYILSEKIIQQFCLLSHFYKTIFAYTEEKSLAQHFATKNIYGEGEIPKRLELNNVGPLISIKWKKSNKAILSPITDNLPKYDH